MITGRVFTCTQHGHLHPHRYCALLILFLLFYQLLTFQNTRTHDAQCSNVQRMDQNCVSAFGEDHMVCAV